MTDLKEIIGILDSLFVKFNEHFFESKLSIPVITVASDVKKNSFGWCTSWKAWLEGEDEQGHYEINICAEYLNRPFAEICETLLHEMVHLFNLENDVKDTSRAGTYHNKAFKAAAEAHGLICPQPGKYGWSKTEASETTKAYFNSLGISDFALYRVQPNVSNKKSSSTRKYVCQNCGAIIRATKEINAICADCDVPFELKV